MLITRNCWKVTAPCRFQQEARIPERKSSRGLAWAPIYSVNLRLEIDSLRRSIRVLSIRFTNGLASLSHKLPTKSIKTGRKALLRFAPLTSDRADDFTRTMPIAFA